MTKVARMVMALVALAALSVARGAEPAAGTLSDPAATVAWTGQSYTTSDAPVPDTLDLTIDLPAGYWDAHRGGVEVAIRWASEYNLFDLYVLNAEDALVASATGFPTSAQSLIMDAPPNGLYHVVVVPSIQVDSGYEGIAQVELAPAVEPLRNLLPNLVPLAPGEFHLQSGTLSFTPTPHDPSCYPDETAEYGAARCLRFDAAIANLGAGPFELQLDLTTMHPDPGAPDPTQVLVGDVVQEIFSSDGTSRATHAAGGYVYHPTHAHMHFKNFATYSLYSVSGGERGPLAVASRKSDFCMIDTRLLWFGEHGNGPRRHHFPQCDVPGLERGDVTRMQEGIDPGWADVYTWDLPGQYIDISAVPDGVYDVVIQANPAGALIETDVTDDCAATRIVLSGGGTAVTSQGPVPC